MQVLELLSVGRHNYACSIFYLGGVNSRIDEEIENLLVVDFDVGDGYVEGRLDAGVHFLKYVRKGSGRNAPVLAQKYRRKRNKDDGMRLTNHP